MPSFLFQAYTLYESSRRQLSNFLLSLIAILTVTLHLHYNTIEHVFEQLCGLCQTLPRVHVGLNRTFPSCLCFKPRLRRNHSYESELSLQVHFHASQAHFHKKVFALRLVSNRGTLKNENDLLYCV